MPDNSSCCCYSYHSMTCFHGLTVEFCDYLRQYKTWSLKEKKKNGKFSRREELGKLNFSRLPSILIGCVLMRTSSLCSVQVPGVWVPWLWAYRGEISFYWLSSGASQLCIWLYIPYQVIFQYYFWIKTHPFVPQINNAKCVPNQCHPPDKQTKRCNKTSKALWGFLVGFLKLPWTFYVHHIFCVPDLNFELSSLLLKNFYLWEGSIYDPSGSVV